MRTVSLLSGLLVSLLLAGAVTAAAPQTSLDTRPETLSDQAEGNCDIENLVHNEKTHVNADAAALNPAGISVLNWNVYKGQRDNWVADFRRYSNMHDVVTIQEANLGDDLISMLDSGHPYWTLNTAFNYHDKATGVMTASTVKPVRSCGQSIAEPFIRFPKTSLISYYPVDGMTENLLVANIHGINFTFGLGVYRTQIEKLYDVIKRHKGPVVLAGDFNTWSDERMQIVDELAERLSLQSLDYTSHNRTIVFGNAIDHVFYRGLEAVEHDTWSVTSSDHNPMHVRFRVKDDAVLNADLAVEEYDEDNC